MLWKLLRVRFWALRGQFRTQPLKGKLATLGTFLFVVGGGGWMYYKLITGLQGAESSAVLVGLVPTAFILLALTIVVGLGDILQRLYLTSEMELLMVAPIPQTTLFFAKVLECSQATWMAGILTAAILIAVGQAQRAPVLYYAFMMLLLLAAMLLATLLGIMLVMGLTRLIPPQRARGMLTLAIALTSTGMIVFQRSLINNLSGFEGAIQALMEATSHPLRLVPGVGLAVGLAGAMLLASYALFQHTFYQSWHGFQEQPAKGALNGSSTKAARRGVLDTLVQGFPAPVRHIVIKEWVTLAREPQHLLGFIVAPLTMAVLIFPLISGEGELRLWGFWTLLLYGSLFGLNASLALGLPALAYEGRNIGLLLSTPLPLRALLWGKFWAKWIPAALIWSLAFLGIGLLIGLPLWQIALLAGTLAWGLAGTTAAGLAMGALGTDFNVESLRQRVNSVISWLATGLNALFLLSTTLIVAAALFLLAPDSAPVAVTYQALQTAPELNEILGKGLWIIFGVALCGQIVLWGGIGALLQAATKRLASWEAA